MSFFNAESANRDDYGVYADLAFGSVQQRFRWLEPGTFWMGSPENEPDREWGGHEIGKGTETLHQVTFSQGQWLADTAVTQALWEAVMGDNPSLSKDHAENPVERVGWNDAQVFIDRLNGLFPGLSARLPNEAEWEYACRAGTTTPYSFGNNINHEQVNCYRGLKQQTVQVKSLPANPWGFYEMHGNVWEWCADVWQQHISAEPVTDPINTSSDEGSYRVLRGGSWFSYAWDARSAYRRSGRLTDRSAYFGFRIALG